MGGDECTTAVQFFGRTAGITDLTFHPARPPLYLTYPPRDCCSLQATVFAIYDADRILQYVGFSKGLRDSLRTLFSRRPEKAQYFK